MYHKKPLLVTGKDLVVTPRVEDCATPWGSGMVRACEIHRNKERASTHGDK
jgi:hypothetical protein